MRRIVAALSFFTRLPLWRLCDVPAECYQRVVPLWPLAGWVTGGVMAGVFFGAMQVLPLGVSIMMALASRVLLTGALHEDGFADFCDGFGGGTTRERTLEIMKDSHIGTYGVLGLVVYYLLMYNTLMAIIPQAAALCGMSLAAMGATLFIVCDTLAKMTSSAIVWWLPYARTAETAKNRLVYTKVTVPEKIITILTGTLPFILFLPQVLVPATVAAFWISWGVFAALVLYMRSRINGYTGDCCGATFIIVEAVIYLAMLAII